MSNYIIDNNINFYEELMKDDEENITNNICLITREQLDKTQIKLDCCHTFNFLPLFKDLFQKTTSSYYTNTLRPTLNNQIECPYCRSITSHLLPSSYDIIGVEKNVYRINSPSNYQMKLYCSYNNNCINKKYMTPLGPYCITHYNKIKNKVNNKVKNNISNNNFNQSEKYIYIANNYTIPQLKVILKYNKLPITGKKSILIERIINANIYICENT